MADNQNHSNYTAADIRRYLSGSMSPEEMHTIEKAALSDPFLAEAIEGYETMGDADFSTILDQLKTRIDTPQKESPVIPITQNRSFSPLRVAAAVLLITAGVAIAYFLSIKNENKTTPQLAKVEEHTVSDSAGPQLNPVPNPSEATTAKPVLPPGPSSDQSPVVHSAPVQQPSNSFKIPNNDETDKYITAHTDEIRQNNNPAANTLPQTDVRKISAEEKKKDMEYSDAVKENNISADINRESGTFRNKRSFNGTVTTEGTNAPVPYANVKVINNNRSTYTDASGRFTVNSDDSVLKVQVAAEGYAGKTTPIRSDAAQNNIRLTKTEAVVTQAMAKKNKNAAVTESPAIVQPLKSQNAEPKIGWTNYSIYLRNNLDKSKVPQGIHGTVTLGLEVEQSGKLSNLHIIRSLCTSCDQEARRVVQDGPEWKLLSGEKAVVELNILF